MINLKWDLPAWVKPIIFGDKRNNIIYGGRGSGKSHNIALTLLFVSFARTNCNIMCLREKYASIDDSVYSLLVRLIQELGYERYFRVLKNKIINRKTQSTFKFKGLYLNTDSLKSTDSIDYCWLEEGQGISAAAWRKLTPSIRAEGSKIIVTMNPENDDDFLYKTYIKPADCAPDTYRIKINWQQNRHFTEVLEIERQQTLRLAEEDQDMDLYNHVWEGETLKHSYAQVFRHRWVVRDFQEPPRMHCYYGMDFGFSADPLAVVRCYIHDNSLYITHEYYKTKVEVKDIGREAELAIPDFKTSLVVCDKSRPDTISLLASQGYRAEGNKGGAGSVEDGIAYIRSFDKVYIHPRCMNVAKEFKMYSYKKDKSSDQVTNIIDSQAGYDHAIDALRYALEAPMKFGQRNLMSYAKLTQMIR